MKKSSLLPISDRPGGGAPPYAGAVVKPKKRCCLSRPRCKRCPIRMLAEGRLPKGFTVKKRRLVKIETVAGKKGGKRRVKPA